MTESTTNMNTCILAIDIGTTAVKVSLFDCCFRLLQASSLEYALVTKQDDVVELDADVYLQALKKGVMDIAARSDRLSDVAAIAVTTQGETLIPVDSSGHPLCNAIIWLDARAVAQSQELSCLIDRDLFYRTTGLPEINAGLPLSKLLYFRQIHPEIYQKTYKFLLLEDYILFWLTGRFVTEKSLLSSTGYFDIIHDGYWQQALDAAGIDADKLPQALCCGEAVGPLLLERARELHLPTQALAVTGAMDQTAAALGAGCTTEGIVTETTGTALVVAAYSLHPQFTHPSRVTIYRHAIDGAFLYLPIGVTAGMALKWFKDQFCQDLGSDCPGSEIYDLMSAMAEDVPAGCGGMLALPHLAGCINPDYNPDARLVFFGVGLNTTRAHFIRAIMESVAYILKDFTSMLKDLGISVSEIRSLGGGSHSGLWQQIKSDVVEIPFSTMDLPEAASAGAALLAAWGLGLVPRGTVPPVMKQEKQYLPASDKSGIYNQCYSRYKELYRNVKPLFQQNGEKYDA